MKKLLGIIVLGLLLNGNAYAKTITLSCSVADTGYKYSIILDTWKKSIIMDRKLAKVQKWGKYEILASIEDSHYILDRVNGTLKLKGGEGSSHGQCITKNSTIF